MSTKMGTYRAFRVSRCLLHAPLADMAASVWEMLPVPGLLSGRLPCGRCCRRHFCYHGGFRAGDAAGATSVISAASARGQMSPAVRVSDL